MATPVDHATDLEPFSAALRAASAAAHGHAEQAPFLGRLLRGELPFHGYGRLVAQHLHLYRALEEAVDAWRHHPEVAPFAHDALRRTPHLEADLAAIYGAGWPDHIEVLPATAAYAARIHEVAEDWPAGVVAHHYVRYLGDLSGGAFIGAGVEGIYDVAHHRGTSFYVFDGIPDPMAFKAEYRRRLDAVPWDADERARCTEEVLLAYRLSTELLEQLA